MPLTPEDLAALSRLLDAADAVPEAERDAWLAALPAADQALRAPLRALLAERARPGRPDFLRVVPRLRGLDDGESLARPGDRVGPYRLLREIGRGGMGSVWLAERADGGLERQVALKLPRLAWDAGLAARMARERDIGARLEHPHIARLYDAGVDAGGRPYIAFAHIDGVALDAYCAQQALGVRARLRLFLQVARAVAYAHGQLVVHRDLKPANVLVDADGHAHLLDFGIGKLIDAGQPGATPLTRESGRAMTPQFASPEQIRGEPITVASDVHGLGVLLYQLLTGALPHQPAREGAGAIEQAILEDEPAPASSRCADRATARALRGEIDAILTKALQREPARRYATVDAFIDDVERHLGGERVLARPDSTAYRLRKALRRHRLGLSTFGGVAAALLLGLGLALSQARRAEAEAAQAQLVKAFVVDMFKLGGRDGAADSGLRQLPAELLLERSARMIDARFAQQPALAAELYGVAGGLFADLGSADLAAEFADRRRAALVTHGVGGGPLSDAHAQLARARLQLGQLPEAEVQARAALQQADAPALARQARVTLASVQLAQADYAALDRTLAALDGEALDAAAQAEVDALRATWLSRQNRFDEAVVFYERAIAGALQAQGPLSRLAVRVRLDYTYQLANRFRGAEARSQMDAALRTLRTLGGPDDLSAALAEADLVRELAAKYLMPMDEALAVIEGIRDRLAERPRLPDALWATLDHYLGYILVAAGHTERGYPYLRRAAEHLTGEATPPRVRLDMHAQLGFAQMYLGRYDEADRNFGEAVALASRLFGEDGPQAARHHRDLATSLGRQGRFDEAEAVLDGVPRVDPALGAADFGNMAATGLRIERAVVRMLRGEPAAALVLLDDVQLEHVPTASKYRVLRGEALCALGRHPEGLEWLQEYIAGTSALWAAHDPDIARARALAGLCALDAGDAARAQAFAGQAREALAQQPALAAYYQAPLRALERRLGAEAPR